MTLYDVLNPNGLIFKILELLGIDITYVTEPVFGVVLIVVAVLFVILSLVLILKCCTSFFRGGL